MMDHGLTYSAFDFYYSKVEKAVRRGSANPLMATGLAATYFKLYAVIYCNNQ